MRVDTIHTGNSKLDVLIRKAMRKDPRWTNRLNDLYEAAPEVIPFQKEKRHNKYGVAPKEERIYDDIVFDSAREMERYKILVLLERGGKIFDLQIQVPFLLQESFISKCAGEIREIRYIADFVYRNPEGQMVVEDAKGVKTHEYKIKKKLFLYKFGEYLFFEV